ncbi:MAG: hypothetical protein JO257_32680 [Deltaproteobacteria bacterium]|nr:hypothetical protein [Deltaproteobacteria bacterium]
MKITSLIAIAVLASVGTADARPRPHGFGGERFEANKTFGIGLELGEPEGINAKWFLKPDQALDFGLGYVYHHYYAGDGGQLYVDYLWHPAVLAKAEGFELPFYVGVGGRVFQFDYTCNGRTCTGADAFGVRVPIGITFDLNNVPLDIFVQAVPTLDFFHNYGPHDIYLDIDFSIGIRFWPV